MGEAADKLMQTNFCVKHEDCVVCERHLTHECHSDVVLGTEKSNVVQRAVRHGVYVNALVAALEILVKQNGEEYAENVALFHSPAYWKGFHG